MIWIAPRGTEIEKPNSFKQLIPLPSRLSTELSYKFCIVWGIGSVLTALGHEEVPQLSSGSQPRYYNHFSTSSEFLDAQVPDQFPDMDPFSLLFLIAALIFLSLGLGALWHYILGPYLRCLLWVRANFNQDTNNTC